MKIQPRQGNFGVGIEARRDQHEFSIEAPQLRQNAALHGRTEGLGAGAVPKH